MRNELYFYDLETSSGRASDGRIMQFAGQRTTLELEPIGESDNILVKLASDALPDPFAILVHGITPQRANAEGISEAELVGYFNKEIAKPGTIFVGYNSVRFDDEFMRRLFYRCLRDPYEWQWKDRRSRWDLLDPIRMMRALRPEGLEWPFASDGKPTVSLTSMTAVNNIEHSNAHDALADIQALIEVARKFRNAQPKLFEYLLQMRDKKKVAALVSANQPFVYTSGKYASEFNKTTVAVKLLEHYSRDGVVVVYDLRFDPTGLSKLSALEIAQKWRSRDPEDRLPLKTLQFNRCPAVAPISVLDESCKARLAIDMSLVSLNQQKLKDLGQEFIDKISEAVRLLDKEQSELFASSPDVDDSIYDGFWSDQQKRQLNQLLSTDIKNLISQAESFGDPKINELAFRYVARNFPKMLTDLQAESWEKKRSDLLMAGAEKSRLAKFGLKLAEALKQANTENQKYLLGELQLYAESILPY